MAKRGRPSKQKADNVQPKVGRPTADVAWNNRPENMCRFCNKPVTRGSPYKIVGTVKQPSGIPLSVKSHPLCLDSRGIV